MFGRLVFKYSVSGVNSIIHLMGQAKQRGTFEERQAMAVSRNKEIERQLPAIEAKNPAAGRLIRKGGVQRLATVLVAAGVINTIRTGGEVRGIRKEEESEGPDETKVET